MSAENAVVGDRSSVSGARRTGRPFPAADHRSPITWLAIALCLPLAGCDWFTDFKKQPKIDPWEAYSNDSVPRFRGNPQTSVPLGGSAAPGYAVSYAMMPATIDSMSGIANPTPVSPQSLANGKKYWQINCAVCHGLAADGRGPATAYGVIPFPLTSEVTRSRSDGYIFGIIRNGRGSMPPYNRIEEMDRWDVVNYLRSLQGLAGGPPDTTVIGRPGETGDKLPGATQLGPTRPFPYEKSTPVRRTDAPPVTGTTPNAAPDSARADTTARRDTTRRDTTRAAGRPGGER